MKDKIMTLSDRIKEKLDTAFSPEVLEIINESDKHIGHAGHDGSGESHFKLMIVSEVFEGLSRVERQRSVYKVLEQEIKEKIHALSFRALSPEEYNSV